MSGVWVGCESKNGYKKTCFEKDMDSAQKMLTILNVIANITEGTYNCLSNLHFDNEQEIHTSSKDYEEGSYRHDLDLLIILHQLHVAISGHRTKNVHFKTHLP